MAKEIALVSLAVAARGRRRLAARPAHHPAAGPAGRRRRGRQRRTGGVDRRGAVDGRDEVARLSSSFNTMLSRLAAARDAQERLVQDAAHELRTPLTSLRTNASVLRRIGELPPDARDRLVADVQGETRELSHLVDELVELALARRTDEAEETSTWPRSRDGAAGGCSGAPAAGPGRRRRHGGPRPARRAWNARSGNLLENAAKFDPATARRGAGPRGPRHRPRPRPRHRRGRRRPGLRPLLPCRRRPRPARVRARPVDRRDVAGRTAERVFAGTRPGGGAAVGFTIGPPGSYRTPNRITSTLHPSRSRWTEPDRPPPGSLMTTETTTSPLHSERPRPEPDISPRVRASTTEREETVAPAAPRAG